MINLPPPQQSYCWCKKQFYVALCFVFTVLSLNAVGEEVKPRELSASDFLKYARRPFINNAWGYFKGKIQHKDKDGYVTLPIEMSILFKPSYTRCQVVLEDKKIYDINKVDYGSGMPSLDITFPDEDPEGDLLKGLGVRPADITFSFLFWELAEEKEMASVRGRDCRVMVLKHPEKEKTAEVYFSADHLFPLKVNFQPEKNGKGRRVEFTEFKKYKNIWYVKTITIDAADWKTRINFEEAELSKVSDKPAPPELFVSGESEQKTE